MRLLDTDIFVDIRRGFAPALRWYASLIEVATLPGYVYLELMDGCANKGELRRMQTFLAANPVVWCSEAECALAVDYFTRYKLSHNLGVMDSLIAACAVGRGATLCTFNIKHFQVIPGLILEQPYVRY